MGFDHLIGKTKNHKIYFYILPLVVVKDVVIAVVLVVASAVISVVVVTLVVIKVVTGGVDAKDMINYVCKFRNF